MEPVFFLPQFKATGNHSKDFMAICIPVKELLFKKKDLGKKYCFLDSIFNKYTWL